MRSKNEYAQWKWLATWAVWSHEGLIKASYQTSRVEIQGCKKDFISRHWLKNMARFQWNEQYCIAEAEKQIWVQETKWETGVYGAPVAHKLCYQYALYVCFAVISGFWN